MKPFASAFGIPAARFLDIDEQDGATTSILSLEDIREEFRRHVADLNAKLDLILSLLGEEALREGARELTEIDPAETAALDALAKARAGKGPRHPAG